MFLLDILSHRLEVVEDHRRSYYGISWTKDGRDLCLSHSNIDTTKLKTGLDYYDSEQGWVSLGGRRGPAFLSAPHQVLCEDELIIATNTGRNCISLIDPRNLFYRNVWLDETHWDHGAGGSEDPIGSHFNSVYRHGDKLYVLGHNFDRGAYVAVLAWPSLEVKEKKAIAALGAHNFWIDGAGHSYVCDSMHGTIIDVESGKIVWQSEQTNLLTRGVAGTGGRLLVGASRMARRHDRKAADGGVFVIDTTTWETLDFIDIQAGGPVCEVRLLDEADYCHHGVVYKGELAMHGEAQSRYETVLAKHKKLRELLASQAKGWTVQCGDIVSADETNVELVANSFALITADQGNMGDVRVSADISVPFMKEAQHAGLVARYRGPEDRNMYAAFVYSDMEQFRVDLWRHRVSEWTTLGHADVAMSDEPVRLEMTVVGGRITLRVAGKVVLEVEEEEPLGPGQVGVRGTSGMLTNLKIENLGAGAEARAGEMQRI